MSKAETLSVFISVYKPEVAWDSMQIFLRLHDVFKMKAVFLATHCKYSCGGYFTGWN